MTCDGRQIRYEQKRPLLCFSAAFSCAALIIALLFGGHMWLGVILCGGVAAVSAVVMAVAPRLRRPVILVGFALGAIWCAVFIWWRYLPATQYDQYTGEITFVAERYAEGYGGYGVVHGKITEIDGKKAGIKTVLYLEDGSPGYRPGDVLQMTARLSLTDTAIKRGFMAAGRYLRASQKSAIVNLGSTSSLTIFGARIARAVGDRIFTLLGGDEAGVLAALLTGDRTRYSREMRAALINSGTSHITAVSGMHISIMVSFLTVLFGRRKGLYAALPVIALYAAVAGFSPSVMRASIMCAVMVISFTSRREADTLTSLFAALLILAAANPFAVLSPSLLLSFSSTLGIILFAPMIVNGLRRAFPKCKGLGGKLLDYFYTGIASSIGAMVFTLPLCMMFFPRVSLISALATVLVLWAVSVAMILGIITLGISLASGTLAAALAGYVLIWPLRYVVAVIKWLGEKRWVAESDSVYYLIAALVLAGVVIAARRRRLGGYAAIAVAVTAFCMFFVMTSVENKAYSDIKILGSDDAAVIMLRSGDRAAAINAGGISRGLGAAFIDDTLTGWGLAGLEQMIITSPGYENVGGLELVRERTAAGQILAPQGTLFETEDDRAQILWYNDSGSLDFGAFRLELYRAGEDSYIPRVVSGQISLANLCGIHPLAAMAAMEGGPETDILIVDARYADSPHTFAGLCAELGAKAVFVSDDGYTATYSIEKAWGGPIYLMTNTGEIGIKTLNLME